MSDLILAILIAAKIIGGIVVLVLMGLNFGWWFPLLVVASTPIGMIGIPWLAFWAIVGAFKLPGAIRDWRERRRSWLEFEARMDATRPGWRDTW